MYRRRYYRGGFRRHYGYRYHRRSYGGFRHRGYRSYHRRGRYHFAGTRL